MSLNDPQWGRKSGGGGGGDGPPDLDELWRNVNRRIAGLFGRKGGGSSEPPGARQVGGGIGVLLALILVVWLASGLYIVDESQRGVVLSFGKYSKTTGAGLQWRLPYPLQSHEIVNVQQVRTIEVGYRAGTRAKDPHESIMLTDDENIVDIQFAVQYVLSDPEDFLFDVRRPEETVKQVAETAFREVVGHSSMDYVLYEGREQIALQAQKLMQDILDRYKAGVAVSSVTMQNAQPPDEVQAAFNDAVQAKQDLERQKNEGQAYYNDVVPKARGSASRLFEEASGYRQRVIANAEGEASRFRQILTEYQKAPQVTRERMYLDTVQQVMSSTSKVMIDARASGNLLFLPLDKLMQISGGAAGGDGAGAAKPSQIEPTPAPDTSGRSRESFRNRDREVRP